MTSFLTKRSANLFCPGFVPQFPNIFVSLNQVGAIVEADPSVLGDERVQRAVEGRFLDSAISVREAAMELVGRHIVNRPDFAVKVRS